MSVSLVVVVLAIGISTMNNVDKMRSVQKSLDMLSMSIGKTEETNGTVKEAENNKEDKQNQKNKTEEKTVDNKVDSKETENRKKTENEQQKTEQSTATGKQAQEDYYTVQRGDTLDKISLKLYGTANHVEAICKMNGLTDGNLIYMGLTTATTFWWDKNFCFHNILKKQSRNCEVTSFGFASVSGMCYTGHKIKTKGIKTCKVKIENSGL